MSARMATEKQTKTLFALLTRMQAAATEIPQRPKVDLGDAEQMPDALKYAVYIALAMGPSARMMRPSDSPLD